MKRKMIIIFVIISLMTIVMSGCSKDKDGEEDNIQQETFIEITMDVTTPVNAGTTLNVYDVAQIRQDKASLVNEFGFLVEGSSFQTDYTVLEGDNNLILIAQFSDGTESSSMLSFTGIKSDISIPIEILDNFKNENTIISNGLTFTNIDGYDMVESIGTININDVTIENIMTYSATDSDNNIPSINVQLIDGNKESLIDVSKDVVKLLFGTIMMGSVDEADLESLLAIEGNEDRLDKAFEDFYSEIISTVEDGVITSAEFYNIDGSITTTPIEVTYLDMSFIDGGVKVPLSYTQYLNVNDKLIGITYTTKDKYSSESDILEKELPKIELNETIFEDGGVREFFTKVFTDITLEEPGIGLNELTDVSFVGKSIIIGELDINSTEDIVEDNVIDIEDTEPEVVEVVDIKETQKLPYSERFKEYYNWPINDNYKYSRYVYVLSGLTDKTQPSQFTGSITNKKDGTVKVSGGSSDSGDSLDMSKGVEGNGALGTPDNNGGTSSKPDKQTVLLTGSSGRTYELSNENIEGVVFDTYTATSGMVSIMFNGSKYYIATMTPTEISRVIGSTGTKPEQSLYPMNDFKGGDFLVIKDNSVTDKTTQYSLKYTSISDGTEKTVPYMACLPTLSSQDWIVIYGDDFPTSMAVMSKLLKEIVQ